MKRTATDYFDGFIELFDIAVSTDKTAEENVLTEAPELLRRSADKRSSLYKALADEFLPPIEREDILDMINALHGLNAAAAELKIARTLCPGAESRCGECMKRRTDMLMLTGKTVRELRSFKKPTRLLDYAKKIHTEYCAAVPQLAGEECAGADNRNFLQKKAICEKTGNFCAACERIACCAEQIAANNV